MLFFCFFLVVDYILETFELSTCESTRSHNVKTHTHTRFLELDPIYRNLSNYNCLHTKLLTSLHDAESQRTHYEWNILRGTVEKNAQHLTMKGKIGAGGGAAPAAAAGGGGLSPDEVAKHNKKDGLRGLREMVTGGGELKMTHGKAAKTIEKHRI